MLLLSRAALRVRWRRWSELKQVSRVTFPLVLYTHKSALTVRHLLFTLCSSRMLDKQLIHSSLLRSSVVLLWFSVVVIVVVVNIVAVILILIAVVRVTLASPASFYKWPPHWLNHWCLHLQPVMTQYDAATHLHVEVRLVCFRLAVSLHTVATSVGRSCLAMVLSPDSLGQCVTALSKHFAAAESIRDSAVNRLSQSHREKNSEIRHRKDALHLQEDAPKVRVVSTCPWCGRNTQPWTWVWCR